MNPAQFLIGLLGLALFFGLFCYIYDMWICGQYVRDAESEFGRFKKWIKRHEKAKVLLLELELKIERDKQAGGQS